MGKRRDMATIQLEQLRQCDRAVFGHMVIARQSTSEVKEASMFIEKPIPGKRKLEKAKSDEAVVLQKQSVYQKSRSFISEIQEQKRRTTHDLKCNGNHLKDGQNVRNTLNRNWHSAEFPTMSEQRKVAGDCLGRTRDPLTVPASVNGQRSLHFSVSKNSSLAPSVSSESVPDGYRHLQLSKRKSLSFYGSSSLSRESSIEEETEANDDSISSVNGKETNNECEKSSRLRVCQLVDELLLDIYGKWYGNGPGLSFSRRRYSANSSAQESDCCSTSGASTSCKIHTPHLVKGMNDSLQQSRLRNKSIPELEALLATQRSDVNYAGSLLVRELKRRDALVSRREKQNDMITAFLQALSEKRSQDTRIRFSVMPYPGDSGFTQWHDAMKMVARLPGGIPQEFRRRLWLTVAEKHLQSRGVDWSHAERLCFNEWSNPDDDELGVQIVKDLHRTGCSLFCGAAAEGNQALLKRVLLAYARWNKAVGYCQGFNMLAALILQVMDRSESDSVKVMIYLIEGVLPESYFANNLRGLSVDMAVFRDLLRLRLPMLSRHLEQLQHDARDSATGTSYEPPLTNVFTMQWFLTLFSNCLPQSTVLRVWDLIFLEGNEVLLRTALAIWDGLADRIMAVNSADEFYSIMGVLTREMLEFGLMDTNNLIKTIVTIAPFPFPELPELRDKYLYNITPWTQTVSTAARRGLRLFYSDDDDDDGTDEDDEKIAVAAAYGISTVFRSPRRRDSMNRAPSPSSSLSAINYSPATADRDRLALDISALKQQYAKLRERQRQAHIILTAACARQPLGPSVPTPIAMNHLLLGKSALLSVRGRRSGPPSGAVPPPASTALKSVHKPQRRSQQLHITAQGQLITASHTEVVSPQIQQRQAAKLSGETLHWKDTTQKKQRRGSKQDATIVQSTPSADAEKTQGIRHKTTMSRDVPLNKELELTTENDTESDDSKSSTSTELCDEPDQLSDFDSEEPTSISETSVQVLSTGEASITKLPSPSPVDNSGLSTSLLLANDLLPLKSLRNAITPSKSRECFVFKSKPVPPSEKFTDNTLKSSVSMDTSQVTCSRESRLGPEDDNAKHTSSEKTEPAAKIGASYVFKQSSSTEKKSPFSSEFFVPFHTSKLKVITSEGINSHDTISKESNDSNYDFCTEQSVENVSEICGIAVSNTRLAQQHITYSSPPEVPHPENKMEEEMSKIPTDVKLFKFTDNCKEESTSVPEITQENHWGTVEPFKYLITDTLQYLQDTQYIASTSLPSGNLSPIAPIRMLQDDIPTTPEKEDIRDSDVESKEELKADIRIDYVCTERSLPEFHRSVVPFSSMPKCGMADNDHDEEADALKTLESEEDRCVSMGENEDISNLLELNLTLQDREQVMKEGDQACEVRNIANMEITETDNAEISEVLEISQNIHLGRRNSENALKIIQENSEILQRILHCQVRRPSKLSEEESNDSNLPSIPTSSSPENSDITPSQQAVSGKMKTVSSDTCIQTVLSPKDDVSVKLASQGSLNSPISIHSLPKCDEAIKIIPDHPQSEEGVSVESKMLHLEKEHVQEPTAEHFDSHCSSIPSIPVDFLKEHEFCKPKQEEKHAPSLGSDRSLSLSQEISNEKTPRFSAAFHILKTETEISDNVMQVLHPSDKQSLSQSEDAIMSNLTGSSVYSSFPLCENIHHMESRGYGTMEAELDRKQTSTIQFDWKRLQALDSSLDGNISSKLPKHYSPQATTHTLHSSYSSKVVKENLQVQDPPVVPVTQTEGITSAKWTDNDDGDIRIDKNFIMTERTSSDLQFHIDTSFPKPSSDSSSSSWFTEKCKLKDGSSATKPTCESHKLSCPSSCYSTCSSDFSTSEHEYSPARTKSWCTEDRSDYFQHNSSKHTESLPSWYTKHSTTRPSDSFILKSSSDRTEISPRGDYLQKSSYSSTQGFTEDFHYSFRPNATSTLDLNSETQDVTSRKSTRDQSRPHSTIISDVASTAVLNRSYSSSSIDGYLTRIRPGLSSPANSSNQEQHPFFKSESDISSSQALDKHTSTVYNPTYEIENSMKVPATAEYRLSTKPPRRNESEPKHSAENLSPPNYSSFPHSRCDKDKPLSPMKSEYRKENFDPNNLSTESPLVTQSLSATKVGISHSNSLSPTKSKNIYVSLPPLKTSNLGSPTRSKSKFDPFPPRPTMRQPRELGIKLGLYSSDCANKNVKGTSKKT